MKSISEREEMTTPKKAATTTTRRRKKSTVNIDWSRLHEMELPPRPPLSPEMAELEDIVATTSRFNTKYGILVDEMGIMHTRANIEHLLKQCQYHLKHSDLELEALGRRTVEECHPGMVGQFDFDYFR